MEEAEDLITVQCRRCHKWLQSPPKKGKTPASQLPRVADRANGWCYCGGCWPKVLSGQAATETDRFNGPGFRDQIDRRRKGYFPREGDSALPGQEIAVRAWEDASEIDRDGG